MSVNQPRRPAGAPTGGQWAAMSHAEADIELAPLPKRAKTSQMARVAGTLLAAATAVTIPSPPSAAAQAGIGVLPPKNPATNCNPPVPGSGIATKPLVKAIDVCRASEGVGPMVLPSNWPTLDPAQQLFVAMDLERVNRGEPPVVGLVRQLDADAKSGANAGKDPFSTVHAAWQSIWASSITPLVDMSIWAYDDGLGGANIDCTKAHRSGCWGHRDALLLDNQMSSPLVAGAGCGKQGCAMIVVYTSMPTWFTWAGELKHFAKPPTIEPLHP